MGRGTCPLNLNRQHPDVVIFLDWTASLDRQALVLFRNELNYK